MVVSGGKQYFGAISLSGGSGNITSYDSNGGMGGSNDNSKEGFSSKDPFRHRGNRAIRKRDSK